MLSRFVLYNYFHYDFPYGQETVYLSLVMRQMVPSMREQ